MKNDKTMSPLERISESFNRIIQYACVISMGSMTIVVLLGVLFRYVFLSPLSWSEELSRYLMIWGASLAITIGIKEKEHVGLTIILDHARSKAVRIILNTIILLVSVLFLGFMIYFSILMTMEAKWQYTQGLGITMILPSLAIPVAMIAALIQLILNYCISPDPGHIDDKTIRAIDI